MRVTAVTRTLPIAPPPTQAEADALFSGLPAEGTTGFTDLLAFLSAHRSAVLAALPWVAAEIAGNDGFEAMLGFVRRHGGSRLYIPHELRRFTLRVGLPVSATTHRSLLKGAGPAALVETPSAWGIFLVMRRVAIEAALREGLPHRVIAHRYGVTGRSLRKPPSSRAIVP